VSEEPEKPTDFINDPDVQTITFTGMGELDFMPTICMKIKLLHPAAMVPQQGSPHSAGYDLFCVESFSIMPNTTQLVCLGFATEIPKEFHGRIESRSGLAVQGLVVLTGVIDSDYRGEWKVILRNFSNEIKTFHAGDKVAQVVMRPTYRASFMESAELEESDRGAGGFGSTGR
jgi:dUTP pyrophosphatase